jgi:molecular chaperone DnaK
VTFDIDANGILHVGAKDKATGKENKITIKANSGLSEDEIQKMVKDAELHAEDDRRARELADTRNQADALVHSTRKALVEHGDKVEAAEKTAIEEALKETEDAIRSGDKEAIEAKSAALSTAAQKLGEAMYAQQQAAEAAAGGGAQGGNSGKDDGDVVDAEYTEVNDKK